MKGESLFRHSLKRNFQSIISFSGYFYFVYTILSPVYPTIGSSELGIRGAYFIETTRSSIDRPRAMMPVVNNPNTVSLPLKPSSKPASQVCMIGISGSSSSGKSTLAHLLSAILPNTILLHADDFCLDISILPMRNNMPDADSRNSIDFPALNTTLDHIRMTKDLPQQFKSWQNSAEELQKAMQMVRPELVDELRAIVKSVGFSLDHRICIVDGFLLYHDSIIREKLDLRLFLRTSKTCAKARRMARPGYGVPESANDFWRTLEYFEKTVWLNYMLEHSHFFVQGNVEGRVNEEVCAEQGIQMQPTLDGAIETMVRWAVDIIVKHLRTAR